MKRIATLSLLVLAGCFPKVGQPVHFEIPAQDVGKVSDFYGKLYGWETEPWKSDNPAAEDYWMVQTPGFKSIGGGVFTPDPAHPNRGAELFIYVDDIDAFLAKAKSLGATVVGEKQPIPDVGFAAHVRDPAGNVTGMFEWNPGGANDALKASAPAAK